MTRLLAAITLCVLAGITWWQQRRPKGTIWQCPQVPAIRIQVWPIVGIRWGPFRQWGLCLVHNETPSSAPLSGSGNVPGR